MSVQFSIVIPIFNEEGNVQPLIESIHAVCNKYDYEILAVDDGSTDQTPAELSALQKKIPALRVISLKRNFGQTAAMAAGIDHANGKVIIPMDGDGQNDPADIPKLLEQVDKGYDVVSGWRKNRKDKFITRKIPSFLANALISYVTGVHLHDYVCTLKAYKRSIISTIQIAGEMHRFLPAWCVWQGGKVTEIVVNHHPRIRGKSKYGLFRIVKVVIDLITLKFFSGYIAKPNYLFSGSGLLMLLFSFLSGGLALFDKFGPDRLQPYRFPLLLLSVFFALVSVFMILMGLLAELLVRLYFQVRSQKPYRLADE